WFSPKEAVEAHQNKEIFLAPPTYLTLRALTAFSSYAEVYTAAFQQERKAILPIHRKERGFEILLPGHADHPESSPDLGCRSLLLQDSVWLLQ
ncbi:MAG: hypothetical protein VX278_05865, partial [Myxococcota bacterium]|nr:hypothetical protein [Myxococcota bacterium]